jgi:hypothetical protein
MIRDVLDSIHTGRDPRIVPLLQVIILLLLKLHVHSARDDKVAVGTRLLDVVLDSVEMGQLKVCDFCGCFDAMLCRDFSAQVVEIRLEMAA